MSVWSDLISSPQQPGTLNLTSHFVKQLDPSLCLHSDVKLVAAIDDTVLSPPLTALFNLTAVYGKKIQTICISCFNIHVRHTDVLKLYHMSLHVQNSVSIYIWDILMFWNCITCHSMYIILFQCMCEMYWCETVMSAGHMHQHSVPQGCVTDMYRYNECTKQSRM